MLRSMYSGVSGLKGHQNQMDVIGNNISNANTTGFKGARVTFKEMLNQTMSGASSPQGGRGGTNPKQIGLGVQVGSIDNDMGQGSLQSTGKMTDMAIQGDGFFVLNDGAQNLYSRAGNMSFDEEGYMVNSANGNRVQGWIAQEDGTINETSKDNLQDITLDETMDAAKTQKMVLDGNLDASKENELTLLQNKLTVEDDVSGATDDVTVSLSKTDNFNQWKFNLSAENSGSTFDYDSGYISLNEEGEVKQITEDMDGSGEDFTTNPPTIDIAGSGDEVDLNMPSKDDDIENTALFTGAEAAGETINADYSPIAKKTISTSAFDSQGYSHDVTMVAKKSADNVWTLDEGDVDISDAENISLSSGNTHTINFDSDGKIASGQNLDLNFDPIGGATDDQDINVDFSELSQFAGDMTAEVKNVDGYSQGELKDFTMNDAGVIIGSYDNGYNKQLAQIGTAEFANPAGLKKNGDTMFTTSNNSGEPKVGPAGMGGRGLISSGTLEMSNVDLADQFTKMITAQRGFQANSKMITTSDEMLQQLVNIKR